MHITGSPPRSGRWTATGALPLTSAIIAALSIGIGPVDSLAGSTQRNSTTSTQQNQQSATTTYGTRHPTPPVGSASAATNARSSEGLKARFDAAQKRRTPVTGTQDGGGSGRATTGLSGTFNDAAKKRSLTDTFNGSGGTSSAQGGGGAASGSQAAGQQDAPAPRPRRNDGRAPGM